MRQWILKEVQHFCFVLFYFLFVFVFVVVLFVCLFVFFFCFFFCFFFFGGGGGGQRLKKKAGDINIEKKHLKVGMTQTGDRLVPRIMLRKEKIKNNTVAIFYKNYGTYNTERFHCSLCFSHLYTETQRTANNCIISL